MNKEEEGRETNVKYGRQNDSALDEIAIITCIPFILLFLFLAIWNYILDFDFNPQDFELFNHDIASRHYFNAFFMLLCPYILFPSAFSFLSDILSCQALAILSLVNPSLQTYLTPKSTKLRQPPCFHHLPCKLLHTSALQQQWMP